MNPKKRKKNATPPDLASANPALFDRVRSIWEESRGLAARSVNTAHVCANWLIGREIIEEEQAGKERADYGKELIAHLSVRLQQEYGEGFSPSALKYMRSFYLLYPNLIEIRHALRGESCNALQNNVLEIGHALRDLSDTPQKEGWAPGRLHPRLSWMHYRTLLRVDRKEVRAFYEIEAIRNGWSGRQLERQIHSLLFERLLKSRDKDGVLALAGKGLMIEQPVDAIKDPYVLEFLNLPESERLNETQLESALISQMQAFLLELGQGFAFVGRQKRLTLEGDHFYPDLVFYHILLRCYVIIDLKTGKLTHGDLGQMQMYVNYYDREIAGPDDNPTVGLVLCTDKNDAMVRYVLDEKNRQIFASRYQTHLPNEEELKAEMRRELSLLTPPEGGLS